MNTPKSIVSVQVQIGPYPGPYDISVSIPIPVLFQPGFATPLDLPDPATGIGFLNSPTSEVRAVMRKRKDIADQLGSAIMKALGLKDTINGYPVERIES